MTKTIHQVTRRGEKRSIATQTKSNQTMTRKWAFSFWIVTLLLLLLQMELHRVVGALDDDELEVEEEEAEDDDMYLRNFAVLVNEETDCRDTPDTFVNCTLLREEGRCHAMMNDLQEQEEDLLVHPSEMCPATCGFCKKPPVKTAVWVDYDCYGHGEDIVVHFTNSNPEPDDFVAVYPAYLDLDILENTDQMDMWLYACGNIRETCRAASGALVFAKFGVSPQEQWYYFPLEPGRYKAALMRHNGTFIAQSDIFTAKAQDHTCDWECKDTVNANTDCYTQVDMIHVTFENCAARNEDRIAIYPIDEQEKEPLLWLDACDSQDCMGDAKHDHVSFGSRLKKDLLQGPGTWPLPPGEYIAALTRIGERDPHGRKVVQSKPFRVLPDGEMCPMNTEEL